MKAPHKEYLIEGIDFCFEAEMDNPFEANTMPIRITSGVFQDIIVSFGRVSLQEDTLSFHYDVLDANQFKNLEQNADFHSRLGDTLISIIEAALEEREEIVEVGRNDNSGIDSQ